MESLVSIIIPAFNADKWLEECIISALSQTWKRIEVIIIDDGSEDSTLEIAEKFDDKRIRIIKQAHCGASASRNVGLEHSTGEFIQYLDADDALSPNKLESQIKSVDCKEFEFVISGAWARFYKNISEAVFQPQKLWTDMNSVDWLVCSWKYDLMMHPAAWLVPRQIALKAGKWNENLSLNDDGEYFCRVILASKGVKFCKNAETYYRSGISNSLSQRKTLDAIESWYYSLELSVDQLLRHENSLRTRYACATRFQRFIYDYGLLQPDLMQKAETKVRELGGTNVLPYGSVVFRALCKLIGWKNAKSIQRVFSRYSYKICF